MTIDKQPEALRLADKLDAEIVRAVQVDVMHNDAANELRRLHAENEDYGATCDHLIRENAEHIGEIVALKEQRDELLEALRNLADLYDTDEGCRSLPEYIAARAAIAKATGETK